MVQVVLSIVDYYPTLSEEKLTPLINMLKDKKWSDMRKWVGQNSDNDFNTLYRKVFNALEQRLEPISVPASSS